MIQYDVKQIHMLCLADSGKGSGDFSNLGQYKSIEEGFTHLKSSSKRRLVLQKIHFGKFVYDETKTNEFLGTLPSGTTGIVLKRKFSKEDGEEYYSEYIYSAWIYCESEEINGEVEYNLNLNFDLLLLDWKGNQKNIKKDSKINLSSTPIFLIENNGNYADINVDNNSKDNTNDKDDNIGFYLNLKLYLIITYLFLFF